MIKDPAEYTYYCLFDPTTGKRLGSYVEGIHKIPTDAIKVSYNDFMLYASSPNWRYDWDKKEPVFVDARYELNLKELREEACLRSQKQTKKDIESGVSVDFGGDLGIVKFDSDLETQVTLMLDLNQGIDYPDKKWVVRGYIQGSADKAVLELNKEQIMKLSIALTDHVNAAKQRGRERAEYINSTSRTVEELYTFVNNNL